MRDRHQQSRHQHRVGGNIWFGSGPWRSLDDAKLSRSTTSSCPAVEEPPATTLDDEKKSD